VKSLPMSTTGEPGGCSPEYRLRLYIGGNSVRSVNAVRLVKAVCEEWLENDYVLEVIDLHQQMSLAARDGIVAVPTLLKQEPFPARRVVGDLTRALVLAGLDLS
jgi:circadian clock protein KaiB